MVCLRHNEWRLLSGGLLVAMALLCFTSLFSSRWMTELSRPLHLLYNFEAPLTDLNCYYVLSKEDAFLAVRPYVPLCRDLQAFKMAAVYIVVPCLIVCLCLCASRAACQMCLFAARNYSRWQGYNVEWLSVVSETLSTVSTAILCVGNVSSSLVLAYFESSGNLKSDWGSHMFFMAACCGLLAVFVTKHNTKIVNRVTSGLTASVQ
eukprot:Platyproteum_vivax@DN5175_c0_g1_i1.p1